MTIYMYVQKSGLNYERLIHLHFFHINILKFCFALFYEICVLTWSGIVINRAWTLIIVAGNFLFK